MAGIDDIFAIRDYLHEEGRVIRQAPVAFAAGILVISIVLGFIIYEFIDHHYSQEMSNLHSAIDQQRSANENLQSRIALLEAKNQTTISKGDSGQVTSNDKPLSRQDIVEELAKIMPRQEPTSQRSSVDLPKEEPPGGFYSGPLQSTFERMIVSCFIPPNPDKIEGVIKYNEEKATIKSGIEAWGDTIGFFGGNQKWTSDHRGDQDGRSKEKDVPVNGIDNTEISI